MNINNLLVEMRKLKDLVDEIESERKRFEKIEKEKGLSEKEHAQLVLLKHLEKFTI